MQEGKERHARLREAGNSACYIFEAEHGNEKICIDATVDDGRKGRLTLFYMRGGKNYP